LVGRDEFIFFAFVKAILPVLWTMKIETKVLHLIKKYSKFIFSHQHASWRTQQVQQNARILIKHFFRKREAFKPCWQVLRRVIFFVRVFEKQCLPFILSVSDFK
jgi:hypothetical protein